MAGVIRRLLRKRTKVLLVALDWTDVRGFHTLLAGAVLKGRAIPLLWASYTQGQLHRSQNAFEESLLRLLVTMLPGGVKVVVLADRGFGRAELAKTCHELKLRYLIRIKPDVRPHRRVRPRGEKRGRRRTGVRRPGGTTTRRRRGSGRRSAC